jgi:RHS repeat-associated protein
VPSYTCDSFGNPANSSGSIRDSFLYTGRELDTETNPYYHRARYYDPNTGRFESEDPIGWGGGINLYQYAKNQVDVLNDSYGEDPNSDTQCLVCTVYGESRGTPSPCQYGVASVILNRLGDARNKDPNKPTSICDIVSAPGAFDAYGGQNYQNCINGCAPSKDQPDLNQTWKLFGQPFNTLSGSYFFGNATPAYEQYFQSIRKYPVPNQYCPKLVFYGGPWP